MKKVYIILIGHLHILQTAHQSMPVTKVIIISLTIFPM